MNKAEAGDVDVRTLSQEGSGGRRTQGDNNVAATYRSYYWGKSGRERDIYMI